MFEVKGAHLAVQRVGRRLLEGFGITPARFDLMNALGRSGMRQCDLWRRLGVVRSVVCEMVRALEELDWVKRVRATDKRTWLVQLTRRGRDVFERAYDHGVESGRATLYMDAALVQGEVESDALMPRNDLLFACEALQRAFRAQPWFRGDDLYCWRPEDYYFWLTESGEPPEDIPFVSAPDSA